MDHFKEKLDTCRDRGILDDKAGIPANVDDSFINNILDTMKRYDSYLELRCLYIQILKRTEDKVLEKASDLGGWAIISSWLDEAIKDKDNDSIIELLDLLGKVPINISRLKTKNVNTPRCVKNLSKHENENISKLALPLYERWWALVNSTTPKKPKVVTEAPPILITDEKRPRNRKSLSWQCDKDLTKVHYFEFIEDERCNVARPDYDAVNGTINPNNDPNSNNNEGGVNGSSSSRNMQRRDSFGTRSSNSLKRTLNNEGWVGPRGLTCVEYIPWKPLIPIDFAFQVLEPGWNSQERRFEADRESGVLRVLDLPGTPQTLSEPDIQDRDTLIAQNNELAKHIPLEPLVPDPNHLRDWSHMEWRTPSHGNNANSLLQQHHAQLQLQQQQQLQLQQQQMYLDQQQSQQILQQQQQQQRIMFNSQQSSPSSLTSFLPPAKIARFYQPPALNDPQMTNNLVRSVYEQPSPNLQWVQTSRSIMNMITVQPHQSHHQFQQHPQQ